MKNVTKILTAAVLCAALFASDQRISALGGNAAMWPGDEANIANFPAQMNNHAFVQFSGIGQVWDGATYTDGDAHTAALLFNRDGTTWGFGFNDGNEDWFNISWGANVMGVTVGFASTENSATVGDVNTADGMSVGFGKSFDWGEIGVNYDSSTSNAGGTAKDLDKSTMTFNWRDDLGFWIFTNSVASISMQSEDNGSSSWDKTTISWTSWTHMAAGGATDVAFGIGINKWDKSGSNVDASVFADTGAMSLENTIGVEANLTDWATFRIGLNHSYQLSGENDWTGPGATDDNASGYTTATGLGFNWGGLTADYTISDTFFNDPVSNITGYDDGKLTSQEVTLTYSF